MSLILNRLLCLFTVSSLLLSCNTEDLPAKNETAKRIDLVKQELDFSKFSNVNISENLEVNWNDYNEIKNGNSKFYEISATEKSLSKIEANFLKSQLKYKVVAIEPNGTLHSYLLEIFTDKESSIYPESISNLDNYKGTFNVFYLNGDNLGSIAIDHGLARNLSKNIGLDTLTNIINSFTNSNTTPTRKIPLCDKTYVYTVEQWTDIYRVVFSGPKILSVTYEGTKKTTSSTILSYPCDGSGDRDAIILQRMAQYNHLNSGGTLITTSYQVFDLLEGRVKCIYDRLMVSTAIFKNAIQKFDGEFPVSHLKLTMNNNLPQDVFAVTIPPTDYLTEIQFDENKFGMLSDLGKATVFAHEIIHAEIFRKMLSAAQTGNLDNNMSAQQQINYVNSMKDNFPGLYDYYYKRYKPTWNHEMMANHYRGTIADIIQRFDNSRLPRATYEAVAWLGLGKLDANTTTLAWDNLSTEEKNRIRTLINENFYNGPSTCN